MIKIEFWLKKPNADQESLEYIAISLPKKIDKTAKSDLGNYYVCEVYLSTKAKNYPIYGINPVDTLYSASEFTKTYLQELIKQGYTISEAESKKPWKLEKLSDNFLQEKIDKIKGDKNISHEDKKKMFQILKESFGKTATGDQLNKAIEKAEED